MLNDKNTSVNEKQVGGRHYKSGYQHWDFVITHELHYLLGCATKYVTRKKEDKHQDLEKAVHYLEKMISSAREKTLEIGCRFFAERPEDIERFATANQLSFAEYDIVRQIVMASDLEDLETAVEMIRELEKTLPANF